jgi:VCBS repeat-containing protein
MRLWHAIFIVTFIILYGTLSVALLGTWVYDMARARKATRRGQMMKPI